MQLAAEAFVEIDNSFVEVAIIFVEVDNNFVEVTIFFVELWVELVVGVPIIEPIRSRHNAKRLIKRFILLKKTRV